MTKFKKFLHFLAYKPSEILAYAFMKGGLYVPDKTYLKILFRLKMGYELNLDNPKGFNEKLQWLKLYNRKPEYINMVDKYEVKKLITSLIGEKYIIPTYGIWNKIEEVDFDSLPNQFVLKTTNGGGGSGIVICSDKNSFNKEDAIKNLNSSLKSNIYRNFREWPYKGIKPRIIAEEYMMDPKLKELRDYKFFCFDGYVDCVMVCSERQSGNTKFYFFDKNWNLLRLNKLGQAASEYFTLPRPSNIDEMFEIASKLSRGIPFVRIDLYSVDGKTYFGEITFFPDSGFDKNILADADEHFGKLIKIDNQ